MFSFWFQGSKCHLYADKFQIYIFSLDLFLELKNRKMNLPVDFTFPKIKYKEVSVRGFVTGESKDLDNVFGL